MEILAVGISPSATVDVVFPEMQCSQSRNPESVSVTNSHEARYYYLSEFFIRNTYNVIIYRIMADQGRSEVVVRKYEAEDHPQVRSLFQAGMMESWLPAYVKTITFRAPLPTVFCQVAQLSVLYQWSQSFLAFLLLQLILQTLICFTFFYLHWIFVQ